MIQVQLGVFQGQGRHTGRPILWLYITFSYKIELLIDEARGHLWVLRGYAFYTTQYLASQLRAH